MSYGPMGKSEKFDSVENSKNVLYIVNKNSTDFLMY